MRISADQQEKIVESAAVSLSKYAAHQIWSPGELIVIVVSHAWMKCDVKWYPALEKFWRNPQMINAAHAAYSEGTLFMPARAFIP